MVLVVIFIILFICILICKFFEIFIMVKELDGGMVKLILFLVLYVGVLFFWLRFLDFFVLEVGGFFG